MDGRKPEGPRWQKMKRMMGKNNTEQRERRNGNQKTSKEPEEETEKKRDHS